MRLGQNLKYSEYNEFGVEIIHPLEQLKRMWSASYYNALIRKFLNPRIHRMETRKSRMLKFCRTGDYKQID